MGLNKGGKAAKGRPVKTLEAFIEDARLEHEGAYTYEHAVYIDSHEKLIITCPKHGQFMQTPSSHLAGRGCPDCNTAGRPRRGTAEFATRAEAVHGFGRFDYHQTEYTGYSDKCVVICSIHGPFEVTPRTHLTNTDTGGCKACQAAKRSANVPPPPPKGK